MQVVLDRIAAFLSVFDHEEFERLKKEHPAESNLLRSDGVALDEASSGAVLLGADACKTTLAAVRKTATRAMSDIFRKRKAAARIDLAGQYFSSASWAVLGLIAGFQGVQDLVVIAISVFGFGAGVAPIASRAINTGGTTNEAFLQQRFEEIHRLSWKAGMLESRFGAPGLQSDPKTMQQLFDDTNELAEQASLSFHLMGLRSDVAPPGA
jgi:hypothetical protein